MKDNLQDDIHSTVVACAIAWAPHKMRQNGYEIVSIARGANDRADFFLVAHCRDTPRPVIVATIYHTTHAPLMTYSNEKTMVYPETCLLPRTFACIAPMMDRVFLTCSRELRNAYGLECPNRTEVQPVSVDVPIVHSDSSSHAEETESGEVDEEELADYGD